MTPQQLADIRDRAHQTLSGPDLASEFHSVVCGMVEVRSRMCLELLDEIERLTQQRDEWRTKHEGLARQTTKEKIEAQKPAKQGTSDMTVTEFIKRVSERYEKVRRAEEAGPWTFHVHAATPSDSRVIAGRINHDRDDVPALLGYLQEYMRENERQTLYGVKQHEIAQGALRERDEAIRQRNEAWEELAVLRGTIEGEPWAGAVLAQQLNEAKAELRHVHEAYEGIKIADLTRDGLALKVAALTQEKEALAAEVLKARTLARQNEERVQTVIRTASAGGEKVLWQRIQGLAAQLGVSLDGKDAVDGLEDVLVCLSEREAKLTGERDEARQTVRDLEGVLTNIRLAVQSRGQPDPKASPVVPKPREKCAKCQSTDVFIDRGFLLTSDPPKFKAVCRACQDVWYVRASIF